MAINSRISTGINTCHLPRHSVCQLVALAWQDDRHAPALLQERKQHGLLQTPTGAVHRKGFQPMADGLRQAGRISGGQLSERPDPFDKDLS